MSDIYTEIAKKSPTDELRILISLPDTFSGSLITAANRELTRRERCRAYAYDMIDFGSEGNYLEFDMEALIAELLTGQHELLTGPEFWEIAEKHQR